MNLTDEQEAALADESDLVCVKAMPGSGKTRLVVEKVRRLLDQGIEPWVLTFTNKAGNEITQRIKELTSQEIEKCGTFHSVFHEHGDKICTDRELGGRFCKSEGYIHFDDVLNRAIERGFCAPSHAIVDECQDNNEQQWKLVQMMRDSGTKLFIVGDLDQSIYGWRGATPEEAESLFREANEKHGSLHKLTKNFRCSPWIQAMATKFLEGRMPVGEINVRHAHIESIDDVPDVILCRTNRDVDMAAKTLAAMGIPVAVTVDRKCLEQFALWMGMLAYPYSKSKLDALLGRGHEVNEVMTASMRTEKTLLQCMEEMYPSVLEPGVIPRSVEVLTPELIVNIYTKLCGGTEQAGKHLAWQFGSHTPKQAASEACLSMIHPMDGSGVQVMTMHQAKGLEFDHVGIACGWYSTKMTDELARLVYVALTRARNKVTFVRGNFSDCGLIKL